LYSGKGATWTLYDYETKQLIGTLKGGKASINFGFENAFAFCLYSFYNRNIIDNSEKSKELNNENEEMLLFGFNS
jgi:hypothetical protein